MADVYTLKQLNGRWNAWSGVVAMVWVDAKKRRRQVYVHYKLAVKKWISLSRCLYAYPFHRTLSGEKKWKS